MSSAIPYSQFIGSNDPYAVLESTARRIAELTEGLPEEQLATPAAPGKWSIHQIVAHLADTELVANVRFRMMLFEDAPTLVSYDQDRWLNGWMREDEAYAKTFERFRAIRESTILAVRNAPEKDLLRYGTHTERGLVTVRDYIITIAGHDINHVSQIDGIRQRLLQAR